MKYFFFILYKIFVRPLSYLPLKVLYGIGTIFHFFLQYIFKYRYKVIYTNLKNSFPTKSEKEIQAIIHQYYWFITDLMAENLKALTIINEELAERFIYKNLEIFEQQKAQNKSISILTAHYGNFEWMLMSINKHLPLQVYSFYNYIANPYFRNEIVNNRTRNGLKLLLTTEAYDFYKNPITEIYANIFASDQSPSNLKNVYWTNFLNQETAFLTGAARYSKMHDTAIVYMSIVPIKRGYYEVHFKLLMETCNQASDDEIMKAYVNEVEQQIIKKPELWLWSHKRWKRKRN